MSKVYNSPESTLTARDRKAGWRSAPTLLLSLICAAIALGLFAWVAEEMREGDTQRFDNVIRSAVHAWASPAKTLFFKTVTQLGSTLFVGIAATVISILLWTRGHSRRALLIVLSLAGASLLMSGLKLGFHRPRPEPFFGIAAPTSYSFPSGHSLISFTFYGVLTALAAARRRGWQRIAIWIAGATLILLIGLSRIYLGVHYPSDVVAGYLAAGLWATGVRITYDRWRKEAGEQVPTA